MFELFPPSRRDDNQRPDDWFPLWRRVSPFLFLRLVFSIRLEGNVTRSSGEQRRVPRSRGKNRLHRRVSSGTKKCHGAIVTHRGDPPGTERDRATEEYRER